jgi:virginiamycin B lyase
MTRVHCARIFSVSLPFAGLLSLAAIGAAPPAVSAESTTIAAAQAVRDGARYDVMEMELPTPKSGPSILAVAPDQSIYVALARAGKLGRVMPGGVMREYDLPPGSFPVGITVDPNGVVWFSDIRRNKIVRLDPETSKQREFDVPTPDSWPFQIVRSSADILYFTERVGNRIGRLDPRTGDIREIAVPTANAQPAGLAITPDQQIFFTENSGNRIGHLDPEHDTIEEIVVPTAATPNPFYGPAGITSDAEGNVWFSELDGRLGLIRRQDRSRIEEFALPNPKVRPGGIVADAWGFVWYGGLDGNTIESYDTLTGVFSAYPIPSGRADPRPMSPPESTARGETPKAGAQAQSTRPFGIAVDATGRVWFSEQYGHRIGVVSPPVLRVHAPSDVVTGRRIDFRVRTRSLASARAVLYELDGTTIVDTARIDGAALAPGAHRLKVTMDVGTNTPIAAEATFHLDTSWEIIEGLLEQLSAGKRAETSDGDLIATEAAAAREAFRSVHASALSAAVDRLMKRVRALQSTEDIRDASPANLLSKHLQYFLLFGERTFSVDLNSDCAALSDMEVMVGDRLTWVNKSVSKQVKIAALGGVVPSQTLEPQQKWSHRFDREGKFKFLCGEAGQNATMTVLPRSASVIEYAIPGPDRVPTVLVIGPGGDIWAAAGGGGYANLSNVPLNNRIVQLSADRKFSEFQTPTSESAPTSIKRAPDGTLWFTERVGNNIGRLDPLSGRITEFPVPTATAGLTGIAVGGNGLVWFTEKNASKIGQLNPATGEIRELPTPHPEAEPSTVVVDHQGNIWFDERGANNLVQLNPNTGAMRQYQVPTKDSRVIGLVPDRRGYLWFLELRGNKVGRLDVATGQIVEYTIPSSLAAPFKAVLDRHGRLWFTEAFGGKIGVLQGDKLFEFALPSKDSMPGGIEIDAEDNLWFTEQVGNAISMIPGAAALVAPSEQGLP